MIASSTFAVERTVDHVAVRLDAPYFLGLASAGFCDFSMAVR